MKKFRYAVVAVTKRGEELVPQGGENTDNDTGVRIDNFEFDVPLNDIAKFRIGTRPIRMVEWKNVVLPN